jgi:rubredoxin
MTTLTFNVFNVSSRCPVCGGIASAEFRRPLPADGAQMKRECSDCGYAWDEEPVTRSL